MSELKKDDGSEPRVFSFISGGRLDYLTEGKQISENILNELPQAVIETQKALETEKDEDVRKMLTDGLHYIQGLIKPTS